MFPPKKKIINGVYEGQSLLESLGYEGIDFRNFEKLEMKDKKIKYKSFIEVPINEDAISGIKLKTAKVYREQELLKQKIEAIKIACE